MTLAVDITDGRAWPYSEERREFRPKKSKVMVYLLFIKW